MVDIEWALHHLNEVFRSETHFKRALRDELARKYGDERVQLDWNSTIERSVDLGVERDDVTIPIEIRYKTKEAIVIDDRLRASHQLKTQSAQDRAHYRFLRDLEGIEEIVADQGRYGYTLLLTNDPLYWRPSAQRALYDEFRVYEGRTFGGETLHWRDIRGWMVNAGEDTPINLSNRYAAEWTEYEYREDITISTNQKFRSLLLRTEFPVGNSG